MRVLIVKSGDQYYGFETHEVLGALFMKDLAYYQMPAMPMHMIGISQYMGQVIPLFSLSAMAQNKLDESLSKKVLLMTYKETIIGICVEDIEGAFDTSAQVLPMTYTPVFLDRYLGGGYADI